MHKAGLTLSVVMSVSVVDFFVWFKTTLPALIIYEEKEIRTPNFITCNSEIDTGIQ